jgi:hypothetical protein
MVRKEFMMLQVIDRVVARLVPRAVAFAGCSQRTICLQCVGAHYYPVTQICCLGEGCHTISTGRCGSC